MVKNELLPRVLTALNVESKVELSVDKIIYFKSHPFKIVNDKKMEELKIKRLPTNERLS